MTNPAEQFAQEIRYDIFGGDEPSPRQVNDLYRTGRHGLLGAVTLPGELKDMYRANGLEQTGEYVHLNERLEPKWLVGCFAVYEPGRTFMGPALTEEGSVTPGLVALWRAERRPAAFRGRGVQLALQGGGVVGWPHELPSVN